MCSGRDFLKHSKRGAPKQVTPRSGSIDRQDAAARQPFPIDAIASATVEIVPIGLNPSTAAR